MEDLIVLVLIALLLGVGVFFTVRHFTRGGGCCGGGGYRVRKKKLPQVRFQRVYRVEGMHCKHCKLRVEEVVNDVTALSGKADLKTGKLTVLFAEDVPDSLFRNKLEKLGYHVADSDCTME